MAGIEAKSFDSPDEVREFEGNGRAGSSMSRVRLSGGDVRAWPDLVGEREADR